MDLVSSRAVGRVTAEEIVPSARALMGHILWIIRMGLYLQRTATRVIQMANMIATAMAMTTRYIATGMRTARPRLPIIALT